MTVKLSKPSKMPCKTWSLEAGSTCPGAIDPATKQPVLVCAGCYAKDGFYHMPDAKALRDHNREDWKRGPWVSEMVEALRKQKYFRWFDSGDVYHPALAFKIFLVMEQTPWVKHWLPTKSYKVAKIRPILERMKALPNVSVRYSSDSMVGEFGAEHGSTVISYAEDATTATVCGAYTRAGKCDDCRACWDKNVAVIAYPAHGARMMKQVRQLKKAA